MLSKKKLFTISDIGIRSYRLGRKKFGTFNDKHRMFSIIQNIII